MNALQPAPTCTRTPLRAKISLDGAWEFTHDSDGVARMAHVPAPWQACFTDLAVSYGRATYQRQFSVPDSWMDLETAICFGAVAEFAIISVNGTEIGRHEGSYLPFEIIVPPALTRAENLLEVVAIMPDAHHRDDLPDFAEIPHGKQSWYGPQGGIWQSVHLESRPAAHIASIRIDPIWPDGRLDIALTLAASVAGSLKIEVFDPAGVCVHLADLPLDGTGLRHSAELADIESWSPNTPALYLLRTTLTGAGQALDVREDNFGFRRIEAKDGCLQLNGQPLYLRGALDQDYYPDGFGTVPSLALLEDQLLKAKAMGLNCLRCHIKVPDPRYYDVADRLGMLIWTEIPNVETFTPTAAARLRRTMEGILARDRNHPSIVIWTLINEDWGTRLREVADQRAWLSDMVDWLRAEDPLRLVVDNSACFPNVHVKTDINDYHYYRSITERRAEWDALCAEFAGHPAWSFSAEPGAEWTRREPLIVSEFGMWGLPDPALLRDAQGRDPWWMAYGSTWADGTALPQGIETRFAELGLSQVFGSFTGFIEAVQWHQYANLKYQIEAMRAHAPIAGYVITELADVHWEGNGLMDMARNPRVFAKALPAFNADVVIVPGMAQHSIRAGQAVAFELKIATGGQSLPAGCRLGWQFAGANGSIEVPPTGPMQVVSLPFKTNVPLDAKSAVATARFTVHAPDGGILSQNSKAVSVYADRIARKVRFAADDDVLAERLVAFGHTQSSLADADVFVTHELDATTVEAIHGGQRVLQIVDKAAGRLRDDIPARDGPMTLPIEDVKGGFASGPYFTFPGYQLNDRHKSIWRGDWVGNFSWLRRDGVFSHLPGDPMFDLSFSRVVPTQVMSGFRPWEFQGRVHAGVVVGWAHKPGAFVIEKRLGTGKFVASTFRLMQEAPDADPVATALWDGLLDMTIGA